LSLINSGLIIQERDRHLFEELAVMRVNTRLMEAGVLQEIRKALMGHSSGEDVNSIYTHIELPAKRLAIQKLEEWVAAQRQALEAAKRDRTTNEQKERTT
jgi:hypothetical protein